MSRVSNAVRGAHAKARSKRWLQSRGYTVFDMELHRINMTPDGPIATKRDQVGADLGYLDSDVVVFVQVKGGSRPTPTLALEALAGFRNYSWPIHCRRVLHIWRPGTRSAKGPEIVAIQTDIGR